MTKLRSDRGRKFLTFILMLYHNYMVVFSFNVVKIDFACVRRCIKDLKYMNTNDDIEITM